MRRRASRPAVPRVVRPGFFGDVVWPVVLASATVASVAAWFSPEIVPASLLCVLPAAGALALNWLLRIASGPHSVRQTVGLVGLLNAPFAFWLGYAGLASAEGTEYCWLALTFLAVAACVALAAYALRNRRSVRQPGVTLRR